MAALNRFRPLDEGYRAFVGLVAGHLAAGIASARSYQDQQRRAEELTELDRAETAFFSNISHEFRTPLTLIMGPVQELRRRLADADPQVREKLEVISRNGLRLGKLVNMLLDFSRIEAGRMQASYEPAGIAEVTAELASVFRSAIDRAGLAFKVDCPPLPEPVYLDRGMWEKVPRLDGLGLVAALRADARTAGVPVLLLSARAGQEASIEGLQAGADDYLVKPLSAAELLARAPASVELAKFRNRESQFRRTLIDSLQEGFFLTDQEGTILEANQAFLLLVGYSSDGLPFRWPHPWLPDPGTDPDGWAMMAQAYDEYKRSGGGRYTIPVRHRDGAGLQLGQLAEPGWTWPAIRRHRSGPNRRTAGRAARSHPGRFRRRLGRGRGDLRDAHHGRPRDSGRGTRRPGDNRAMVQCRQPRSPDGPGSPRARVPPPR